MADKYDDIDNQSVIVTGVVGAVLVFVIVLGLQAAYYHFEAKELERKVVQPQPEQLRQLTNEQLGQLLSYRWVDQKKKMVAIPIDRAMELEIRDLSKSPASAKETKP